MPNRASTTKGSPVRQITPSPSVTKQKTNGFPYRSAGKSAEIPYTLWRFFEIVGIQIMLLQKKVEVCPVFAGESCCFSDLPLGEFEKVDEIALLKGISGFFQGLYMRLRYGPPPCSENQILCDKILVTHGHGIFDYILQLPHVSRPIVEHELLHGFGGNSFEGFFCLLAEDP